MASALVTSKSSSPASGQVQRIMVRQPDGTNVQFAQQLKQQPQGRIVQSSSAQPGTQTKMISAAELQKLISSGAVKTVTRTSATAHSASSDSTSPVVRQIPAQERIVTQQPLQQQVKNIKSILHPGKTT